MHTRHRVHGEHRARRHRTRILAAFAIAVLILAACGGDDSPDSAALAIGTTPHGDVLVDGEGMTLYVFDPDAQGLSTCYDACAQAWPPLLADGGPSGNDGVEGNLLATTTREDGATQVTYDGWPLYHWASDSAPGDATGQGVQGVWWVIAADGTVLRDGEAASAEAEPEPEPEADADATEGEDPAEDTTSGGDEYRY